MSPWNHNPDPFRPEPFPPFPFSERSTAPGAVQRAENGGVVGKPAARQAW